jgi:hypothetical protein
MEVKPVPEPEWQGTELELPPLPLFLDKITKEMRALDEKRRLEGVRAMSGIWADGPPRSRTPEEVAALRAELRRKMEARRK